MSKKDNSAVEFLKNYEEARKTPKESPEYQEAVQVMAQWAYFHEDWEGKIIDIFYWAKERAQLTGANPYLCYYVFNKETVPSLKKERDKKNGVTEEEDDVLDPDIDLDTPEIPLDPKTKKEFERLSSKFSKIPKDSEKYKTTLALVHLWFDLRPTFDKNPDNYIVWASRACSVMKIDFKFYLYLYSKELFKLLEEKKEEKGK